MARKKRPKPRLNQHGATMGEELLLPEKKRESLAEFEARRELGHKYAAEEQQMFEDFCASFPLPDDT